MHREGAAAAEEEEDDYGGKDQLLAAGRCCWRKNEGVDVVGWWGEEIYALLVLARRSEMHIQECGVGVGGRV